MKRNYRKIIKRSISFFLETIFPRFCIGCEKEGSYICNDCVLFLSEARLLCSACGKDSRSGKNHLVCNRSELNGLVSLWDHESVIKQAIERIKVGGVFHILEELTEYFLFLAQRDQKRLSSFLRFIIDEETVVTFVPLGSQRKKERGFDQSEILADYLARSLGKKKEVLLKRVRETEPQDNLEKEERRLNVKDAFSFVGSKTDKVVIIDDIWTSGATMKECCRVMRENGVREIWGFTIAINR